MEVLGWEVAKEDAKNKPFAKELDVLEVNLNLESLEERLMGVSHKEGWAEQIIEDIKHVLFKRATFSAAEAATIAGRFHYLDTASFGWCGAVALHCEEERDRKRGIQCNHQRIGGSP